ncbi:MAG: hypothetical protein KZQ92_21055 [Candidatus Thiodiazotropha sp. (ex Lucinoma borealis)]|nr:hypothetical protein [Candidatus Thiodiazotropha sp. (ex Lucinoma borealis)]
MGSKSLKRSIDAAISASSIVLDKQSSPIELMGISCIYWPLIFRDRREDIASKDIEIDSCATSMGIIGVTNSLPEGEAKLKLLQRAAAALLEMREADGEWLSVFEISDHSQSRMEGVVNDTSLALLALTEIGFSKLENWPLASDAVPSLRRFEEFSERIEYLRLSVQWLADNTVKQGWYYTGIKYIQDTSEIEPKIQPTTTTINTLRKLAESLPTNDAADLISKIDAMIVAAFDWLKSIKTESGGFGLKSDSAPTLVHTALVTLASSNEQCDSAKECFTDSAYWLLRNGGNLISRINKGHDKEKYVDHYAQIFFDESLGDYKYKKKREIQHESFVNGFFLMALCEIAENKDVINLSFFSRFKLNHLLRRETKYLLKTQNTQENLRGAFSGLVGQGGRYPIYATTYALKGLLCVREALNRGKLSDDKHIKLTTTYILLALLCAVIYGYLECWDVKKIVIAIILAILGYVASVVISKTLPFD